MVDRNFVDLVVFATQSIVVLNDPGVGRLSHGASVHLDVEFLLLFYIAAALLDQLLGNVRRDQNLIRTCVLAGDDLLFTPFHHYFYT